MNKKPDVPEELNVEAKPPVLQDGFDYSFAEVDRILNNYMKGQVK